MFPTADLRVLIEYLRGQGDHTWVCAMRSLVNVLQAAVNLLPDTHPHPMMAVSVAMLEDPAKALEELLPTEGVAAPERLPSWVLPLLLDILRRLLAA